MVEDAMNFTISSPDGHLVVESYPGSDYCVRFKNEEVIRIHCMNENGRIIEVERGKIDEIYEFKYGKQRKIRNLCNTAMVKAVDKEKKIAIELRVYNDGFAFRYHFSEKILIKNEKFVFPESWNDSKSYPLLTENYQFNYEGHYDEKNLRDLRTEKLIAFPFVVKNENICVAISEANLENYGGTFLTAKNNLKFESTPQPVLENKPTPWRVIMISEGFKGLIESNIILNLNEPSKIKDESWITPGKVAWHWWSGEPADEKTITRYVDFASKNNIEYVLVDAGWYSTEIDAWERSLEQDLTKPLINIPLLIKAAHEKGVKVILWVHASSLENQFDETFETFGRWKVDGIKVDSEGREDRDFIGFCVKVAERAAEKRMIVDFHGSPKPTGMRRTYPNVLTSEGVLGLEHTKWNRDCTLKHQVTIPFTRMLVGPMDFTPGALGDYESVEGTKTRQLAMYVVYESPLQMLVDLPEVYESSIGFKFIKGVPTTWDETRFIGGEIGKYAVIARRKEDRWWVGAMTNEESRRILIPLDFLGNRDKGCKATIYQDQNGEIRIERIKIDNNKKRFETKLESGGGFVMSIEKE